ncbi:hypothetical protein [Brevibacillus parabrevis]|uniref:hypothetical protein n=1 Tax=Brevibacillus parabrevis TaxID=54914 RepID=UPI0028D1DB7A|nr:hypothetical protein [Brevibacillus parabrevis]
MTPGFSYREVTQPSEAELRELARLLVDVVADGASIGFLPPLAEEEAYKYWTLVPREQEAGRIPQYAKSADGELHDTAIYYKQIGE